MTSGIGAVEGGPRLLLRLEGLAILVLATALFASTDSSWWLFGLLFLTPDLALLGYLANARVGAVAYNAAHTYVGAALLWALSRGTGVGSAIAFIWAAHIGMDRSIGLGLKYAAGFRETHLGTVGSPRRSDG